MNAPVVISTSNIANAEVQTVNARDLHAAIESKQDFSTWIKSRLSKMGFVEGEDYLVHNFMEQLPSGAKQKIDYHLSLDTAKEMAMVEYTDKGRAVRRYFIECEKELKRLQSELIAAKDKSIEYLKKDLHETMREMTSDPVVHLMHENEKLRDKAQELRRENCELHEELNTPIKRLSPKLREECVDDVLKMIRAVQHDFDDRGGKEIERSVRDQLFMKR